MVRYPQRSKNGQSCVEPGCIFLGRKCSDGKYRCEPHFVKFLYASGAKEAKGGFIN